MRQLMPNRRRTLLPPVSPCIRQAAPNVTAPICGARRWVRPTCQSSTNQIITETRPSCLQPEPGCASITGDSATCRRSQDSQTVTSTRSWRMFEISRESMDSNRIRRRGTRLPVRPVAIAHLNRKTRPWTRGIDNRLILRCGRALGCDLGSVPISVSGSRPLPSPGGDGLGCPHE